VSSMASTKIERTESRFPEVSALRRVFSHRRYLVAYAVSVPLVGVGWAFLLEWLLLRTSQLVALRLLTTPELVFSAGMGLLLPAVLLETVYVSRDPHCVCADSPAAAERSLLSLLVGLLPNALCCTPIIPLVLAVFLSGSSLITVSGPVQYVLAVYSPLFYALALASLWWSLRSAARQIVHSSETAIPQPT
jgi:hypothetical protein